MVISLVMLVLVVGLLMYVLAKDSKIQEIGRIMFAFGLLALLLGADKVVGLIRGA